MHAMESAAVHRVRLTMERKRTSAWWRGAVSCVVVGLVISTSIWPFVSALDEGQPKNFKYIHLWTSQDGQTHVKQCKMHNFTLQPFSNNGKPQYNKNDFGGLPQKMVFTELPVGLLNPLHSAPSVQFVVTLMGKWYINTTDGTQFIFKHGDVLFQDNIVTSPANKVPQHVSGNAGDVPCQQYVVQFNRTAQVDNPCPFYD